jgi:uncharacterized OsmC-like protein
MSDATTALNGLRSDRIEQVVDSLRDPQQLEAVNGPWFAHVEWTGGFRAVATTRSHTIAYDEPEGLDATDTAASAHEHLLSAIGACITVGFVLNATRQGVAVERLSVDVDGTFDDIGRWAGLNDTGNPGYRGVRARVAVKADADDATLEGIWRKAIDGSPVLQSVARATPIEPEFIRA